MSIEKYLSSINLKELKENIKNFNALDLANATDFEIENAIIKILAVDNKISNPIYILTIPKSKYFCRVRLLNIS